MIDFKLRDPSRILTPCLLVYPQQIKANIAAHFTPQPIKMGGLKRALAPAASKALTTEEAALPFSTRVLERALFRLSRH